MDEVFRTELLASPLLYFWLGFRRYRWPDRTYQPSITTALDQASSEERPHSRHQTSTLARLFGKLRSFGVDADVYAQPLYLSKYKMADGQLHNVLFVATAHDSVYAFDGDGNNPAEIGVRRKASRASQSPTPTSSTCEPQVSTPWLLWRSSVLAASPGGNTYCAIPGR
jgi:hypothetical protein